MYEGAIALPDNDHTIDSFCRSGFTRSIYGGITRLVVCDGLVLDLVEIQHIVALAAQIAFKAIERDPDYVAVMDSLTSGDLTNLEPDSRLG